MDTTKKKQIPGGWMVFLGAAFWSLNAPLVKFIDIDALLVCGLRSLIAGVVLFPFIRIKKLNFTPWMLVYIVSYFALCMGIILSLSYTSAAIAIGMQYAAMIWIFIADTIVSRVFSARKFFPVMLIFSGVICFMLSGIQDGSTFGNLIALTESISFALMTVSSRKSAGDNPIGLAAIANICTGLFIFLFLSPRFADVMYLSGQEWLIMIVLGVVQVALGYTFFNIGVTRTTPQKASILSLWEMILGSTWVALFLGEYPSLLVLSGFVIILAGMVLAAIRTKEPAPAK